MIQRGMVVLITYMSTSIIGDDSVYAPNMEAILKVIQPEMMLKLIQFFEYAGLVVVIAMISYSVVIRLIGNVMEIKDSLTVTFARAGVSIVFIFFLVHPVDSSTYDGLLDKVLVLGNNVYSNAINTFTEEDAMTADTDVLKLILPKDELNELGVESDDDSMSADSVTLSATANTFVGDVIIQMVLSVLRLILVIVITYLMIKLIYEIIKHFVNIIGLYVITPFMASFFVSSNTATITSSFLRMFCSEIIMMVFCRVWTIVSLYIMYNYVQGVPGMFVTIAFIQFGIVIDNILKTLGFATSNTGGALLDSVNRAGMALAFQSMGAKSLAGGGLIAAGNALGKTGFNKMGSLLKTGSITPEAVARTQDMGVSGALRSKKLSSDKTPITPGETANMKSLFDKGNMGAFAQKYNALSNANKQVVNDAIGRGFENFSDSLASGSTFSISGIDSYGNAKYKVLSENGNILSEGSISRTKNMNSLGSIPLTDANGSQWYANVGEVTSTSGKNVMPKDIFSSSPDYKADSAIRTASQMGLKNFDELNDIIKNGDLDGTHYQFDSDNGNIYYQSKGEFDSNFNSGIETPNYEDEPSENDTAYTLPADSSGNSNAHLPNTDMPVNKHFESSENGTAYSSPANGSGNSYISEPAQLIGRVDDKGRLIKVGDIDSNAYTNSDRKENFENMFKVGGSLYDTHIKLNDNDLDVSDFKPGATIEAAAIKDGKEGIVRVSVAATHSLDGKMSATKTIFKGSGLESDHFVEFKPFKKDNGDFKPSRKNNDSKK